MSKFKKFISLILALAMCLTLFGTVTFADTTKASVSLIDPGDELGDDSTLDPDEDDDDTTDDEEDTEDTSDDDSEDDEDSSGSDEITSDNAASDGEETVTVSSSNTITLTIEGTTIGHTYTIYQLLTGDITVNDDGEAILANAEAGSSVNTNLAISDATSGVGIEVVDFIISALQGGDYEITESDDGYKIKSSNSGAVFLEDGELSTAVYDLIEDGIVSSACNTLTASSDTVTFSVPEGYYIIVESASDSSSSDDSSDYDTDYRNSVDLFEEQSGATISRCIVILVHENMSASSAVITLKNTTPTIDKNIVDTDANAAIEAGTESVYGDDTINGMQHIIGTDTTEDSDGKVDTAAIGDTIEYELTGYLPDTTGYEYYYYVLTDTMSQGLTLNLDSFEVTVECEGSATTSTKDVKTYCINEPVVGLNGETTSVVSNTTTLNGVVFIVDIDNLDKDESTTDWVSTIIDTSDLDGDGSTTDYLSLEYFYTVEKDTSGEITSYDYGDYDYFIYVTYEYEYEYDADGNVTETIATDEDGNRIVTSTTFRFTLLDLVDQVFAKASNEDVLTVYYTAELNANAEVGYDANTNNVTLEYSNNPNSSEEYIPGDGDEETPPPGMPGSSTPTGTTTKIWTYTYTTEVTINKVASDLITENDDGTANYSKAALSGAQFTLTGGNLNSVVVTAGEAYVEYESPTETYYLLTDGTYTTTAPSAESASDYETSDDGYVKYSSPVVAYLLADGESYTTIKPTDSTLGQYTYETVYTYSCLENDGIIYYELEDGSYVTTEPTDDTRSDYVYSVEYTYTTAYVDEDGNLIYFLLADETYTTTIPTSDTIESYVYSTEKGSGVYITIEVESEDGETTTYYFTCYVLTTVLKAESETSSDETTTYTVVGWVDSDGSLTFTGLNAGTYTLTETVTPEGYNTIDPITFTIGVSTKVNESGKYVFTWTFTSEDIEDGLVTTSENGTFSMVIVDTLGFLLPSTGAIGQIILYALGILLVFGAGTTLIVRRRRNKKSLTN